MDVLKPQSRRELYKEADAIYDLLSVRKYEGREVNSLIDESENTEEFWKGEFGDEYTLRNRVNWLDRVPFWTEIIAKTGVKSVIEVGCNTGWNLLALRTIKPSLNIDGVEINKAAIRQAANLGFEGYFSLKNRDGFYDLVFTAGVLIHQETPIEMMESVIKASRQYVLAIEYYAEQEEEVEYRGHKGKLWKRNYGQIYQDMGLTLMESGDAQGFDQCKYWLFSK